MSAEGSIDKLSIEVSSTASDAVRGIKDLSSALVGLESSIGGNATKLADLSRGISALKNASSNLRLDNLKQLSDLKLSSSVGGSVKSLAAAVSLMPADSQARLAPIASLKALDGVKMSSSLGGNLTKIATALAFMPTDTASRVAGLSTLKHLSGVKISATVPNNLHKLAQAVSAFPQGAGSRLTGLASALLPLKQLNGMKITTALNGLRELPAVLKQYETLNVGSLVAQLDQLNPRLKSLAVAANSLKTAFNKMPSSLRTVAAATRTVTSANGTLNSSMKETATSAVSVIGKFGTLNLAFHYLWNGMASCVNEVNKYIENMNLFEASMGGYTESAAEFGNTVQNVMGIDFGQWARNQGVFQTLITGMGDTADRAAVMSQQLTQLGYDISSFYNISVDDAMLKIQSGVAGELEPLRRLGWDLSDARMNFELAKMGIDKSTQSMTQAEKVGLRYYMIMNQVTQVHGDMARTIASPANQLRVLQAQVTLAARAVGSLLIPMLNMILPYAIAAAKAIRLLAQTIASFFGIDASFEVDYSTLDTSGISTGGVDDLTASLDDSGKAADKAKKKVQEYKNTVMGFDELNKLNDTPESASGDAGGGGAGSGGGGGLDLPLDTYDFLAGLDDYITKLSDGLADKMIDGLKKIAPAVAGIGAGIGAWKIGKGLISGLDALSGKLKVAGGSAMRLADNLSRSGNPSKMKIGGLVGDIGIGLGFAAAKAGDIAKSIGGLKLAGVAAAVAVIVGRTADLWLNSERFGDGVAQICGWLEEVPGLIAGIPDVLGGIAELALSAAGAFADWVRSLTGIDLSFLEPVISAFKELSDFVGDKASGVVRALNLDFADLGITVAGLAMVISGVGAPLGAALLAFEAVTLAVRAIGYAADPCVESMDALAGASEETAGKLGTSLDSMESAINEIDQISFSDAVVTDEDVQSVGDKCADIRDTILNNLDAKRNEELSQIDAMAGFMTAEEIESAKARVNESYDQQKAAIASGTQEISEILNAAKENGVALSQEQSARVNEILDQQYQQLIETSGASSEEIAKINEAMRNNSEAAALEAASSVIQEAQRVRDERKATAEEDYANQVAVAQKMLEAGDIDKQRYDEIVAAAEEAKNLTLQHADEQYQGIVDKTESGLGEAANKFDFETGEIKSNWDVFLSDLGSWWDGFSSDFGNSWNRAWSDAGNKFEGFKSDVGNAWQSLCSDINSWYRSNLEPTISDVKYAFQVAGNAIGGFLSNPVGTIKSAWGDLCSWFDRSIVRPIQSLFRSMHIEIPAPKLPHIEWSWREFSGPFGSISIPEFNGISWYAQGGFPTSGQLFMAREDGLTEMVGTMGGKSAVANNQQIVEGIERGVISAMLQVLPSFQPSQDGDVTMVLQVGNEVLARAVNKGNASMARRGQLKPEIQFA
ncbi:hypothetical protein [Adlercreutzia sp. ZJ242]|uniref:hypothetical protein n=1 Tax=Adlercreutzia sp. ZJ242 TaxID=2709409 RepID=UPI0013EC124C|nr:hypothetical protein [Adlercreutzia sp. ZJ242]